MPDTPAFGIALDPFRPQDISVPPGVTTAPPICPSKTCIAHKDKTLYFLYVNNVNAEGDVLLSCLNCGYEAVYRIKADTYEPRPGREVEGWNAPYLGTAQLLQKVQAGEPTKVKELKFANTDPRAGESDTLGAPPGALLTVKQAAKHCKKDVGTLYWAIKHGQMKAMKSGRKTIVAIEDLEAYLKDYPARG